MATISMVFDLIGRDKSASAAFSQVGDAADKTGKKVGAFGGAVGGAMKAAGAAIAGIGIASVGKQFIDLASNAQQSVGGVDAVFKSYAKSVQDRSKEADRALGLSANSYRELATVIGSQLKNAGVPMEELGGNTDKLISQGADLAAMFGGTTQEAVGALSSALKGEMDPIEKYGISLNDAALKAEAASLGLEVMGGTLTNSQKVMAVQSLVTKQAADATGAFGRESDTAAGRAQRASAQWENLKTTLGSKLLPAWSGLMDFVGTTVLPGMDKIGGVIDTVVGGFGAVWDVLVNNDFGGEFWAKFGVMEDSKLVDFLFDVRDALAPMVKFVKENATPILVGLGIALAALAAPAILGAIGAVATAIGGVLLGAIGALLSPVALLVLAIGGVVGIFVKAYQESEPLRAAVDKLKGAFDVFLGVFGDNNDAGGIRGFFDGIKAGIEAAWPMVKAAMSDMGSALWTWIEDNIAPALAKLGGWMAAVGSWIWNTGMPALATAALNLGQALIDWIGPMIKPALEQLGKWGAALADWIWNTGLPWLLGALGDLGQALIDWIGPRIGPMLGKLLEWGSALIDWLWNTGAPWLWDTLVDLSDKLVEWIGPRIPELLGKFGELMGRVVGWLMSTGLPLLVAALVKLSYELVTWIAPRIPGILMELLKLVGKIVWWLATEGLPMMRDALWDMGIEAIKGLWESIQSSPLVQKMTDIFQGVVDSIGRAWDGLKGKLSAPLRAVVTFVNDKVIDNLNKVTKVFGLTIPSIPQLADGAVIRRPTLAMIGEAGPEVVIPLSASRARQRSALMAEAGLIDPLTGSTEIGGPLDFAKGAFSWAGDKIGDLVAKGVGFALEKIIRPVGDWVSGKIDNPFIRDFSKGVFSKTADAAKRWGDDRESTASGGGTAGSGALGGNWQTLFNVVKAAIPQARINSAVRNTPDAHGRGKAVDFGFGTGPGGAGSAGLASIARYLYTNFGKSLYELIYTGIGGPYQIKNGRDIQYNAATRAAHTNHVHAAVYDDGGWLKPGYTLAYNGTGQSERVRTAEQESAVSGTSQPVNIWTFDNATAIVRALENHRQQQAALAPAW